ncbi:MAG: cupin domain-containing protein [Saprospiraceae bacterium]|nr:cupin domain-containing protein [Saprospiraceae bacterium]
MAWTQTSEVDGGIYRWAELPVKISHDRESRKIMEGSSPYFDYLEMHATTQYRGAVPNPPHKQQDIEEIIIVKEGLMRFTMNGHDAVLGPGSVILIPPLAMQALENIGDSSLTYYVIMFRSRKPMDMARSDGAGGYLFVDADTITFSENSKGGRWNYLDRPTAMCEHLHIHTTQLNEFGPSIPAHSHPESELFIVMEGQTELMIDEQKFLGQAGDLYLVKPGQLHGMSNASDAPCRFFAIKWK